VNSQQSKLFHKAVAGAPGLRRGSFCGDDDIAQQLGVKVCEFALGHPEGEHVGWGIDVTVLPVELANARVGDYEHADFGVGPSLPLERLLNGLANWREPYFRPSY